MRKWTKSAGILFLAASSVYFDTTVRAQSATTELSGDQANTDVALLDSSAEIAGDPVAGDPVASDPAAGDSAEPAVPATQGQSVKSTDVIVSDAGTVELHVNDANLVEVLRMLSMQSQKNIIASKEVRGTVTANLYDVTLREALDAILNSNGYAYREKGNFIYVYTAKELADIEKAERIMKTEVITLHYILPVDAEKLIKQILSPEGKLVASQQGKVGIEFSGTETGGDAHANGNVLIITDYTENLEEVQRVIRELDHRPQQVLVEATILQATLNENNSLGFDFTILGGVDFSTLTDVSSGPGAPSGSLNDALTGNILNTPNSGSVTDSGFVAGRVGGGGLNIGIVKNNIGLFIDALESVTDTVVLANPKVLVLNRQKGEVKVVRRDPYRGAIVSDASNTTRQEVEFQETGTKLIFRPYIGNDGYIRLEVHPEDSSVLARVSPELPPSQISTEATTNVMVKDGHTIVIGGLFRESNLTSRSQVPFLGNLPIAGPLFRSQIDSTVREEIIILLTPHIVQDEAAYSEASEAELEAAQKLRVGVRQGMMPWGRERLAESSYERAVEELNKPQPNRKKALWHLNCATNLNPKFLEAIELKENLTGKEVTAADNSTIRHFVKERILAERLAAPTTLPAEAIEFEVEPVEPNQPTVRQETPTTQPVAVSPTTQPVAEAPRRESGFYNGATQLVLKTSSALQWLMEPQKNEKIEIVELVDVESETGPAIQPEHGDENASGITVTELPMEEE